MSIGYFDQTQNKYIKTAGNGTLEIDSKLSDTSENAVQNKIINSALNSKGDSLSYNEDTSMLQLMSGDTVLSEIEIQSGGASVSLGDVSGASATASSRSITLTWSDPEDVVVSGATLAAWTGTLVVRKEGSAPTSKSDGTVVIDSTTRNQYASTGYTDTGLTNDTTYYYRFFPHTSKLYTDGSSVSAVPERIVIASVPSQSGTLTYSGSAQSPSWNNYNSSQLVIGGAISSIDAGTYAATFVPTEDYKWSDGSISEKSVNWSIGKANGSITLSSSSVTLNTSSTSVTVTATVVGDYTLTANTSDSSVATASVSGKTITINNVNQTSGSATITVSAAATTNYNAPSSKTVSVTASFKPDLVSFSTGTDAQIQAMLDGYYDGVLTLSEIQSVWKVGDSRNIAIAAMSNTDVSESHHADTYAFTILDFNHDTLTTAVNSITKALVSLQMKRVMYTDTTTQYNTSYDTTHECGYMNSSNTNAGGWTSCARRTWCNNVFYAALPSWVQSYIKSVNKLTSAGSQSTTIQTTSDKCWLPSEVEVFGSTTHSVSGEGSQYSYFTTAANRYKLPAYSSSRPSAYWWERSPRSSYSTSFCRVGDDGTASGDRASNAYGLAPAFCL